MTTDHDPGELALFGGPPVLGEPAPAGWPVTDESDRKAVEEVLLSGLLVSDRNVATPVDELEARWARFLGVAHCVGVSNGTTALEIALLAEGVRPGDEVIVPALSFVATAMAVCHVGARPVFADVDPVTYTIDPDAAQELIGPRTTAIMPVHLHGLSADMERIDALATARGLAVVEDAAQAHGARHGGTYCGARGNTAAFSLQMTKNLPTCGEGGLIVTDDPEVADRARLLRQFGERIQNGRPRRYVSHRLGFNAKLSGVQAAYTLSQLERFGEYHRRRRENVARFLDALAPCERFVLPGEPEGDEHAWHILRFGLDVPPPAAPGARQQVMRALRAEGVPVSRYQVMPLPEQPALRREVDQDPSAWRHAGRVVDGTFTLQQRHLRPDAGELLARYAEAFTKVHAHLDRLLAGAAR